MTAASPGPDEAGACALHPGSDAPYACVGCQRRMCDLCYEARIDDAPACLRCAYGFATRRQRGISLAISLVGLGAGLVVWLVRNASIRANYGVLVGAGALLAFVAAPIVAIVMLRKQRDVERRDRDAEAQAPPPSRAPVTGGPYRSAKRPLWTSRLGPRVSGAATAGAVGASLATSAVLLPFAFELPRWIEAEVVLGAWWLLFASVLSLLLYRGYRLKDDFLYVPVWDPARRKTGAKGRGLGGLGNLGDGCGSVDAEGCAIALAALVAIVVAVGAAWLVVELALPVVLFLVYALILRALNRVARDHHGCRGRTGRALGWGAIWASIYVAPLALVVVLLQVALGRHPTP